MVKGRVNVAQFDIYKTDLELAPLLLEVQSNLLSGLDTKVVIPLIENKKSTPEQLARLHPIVNIEGTEYIIRTAELGAVPKSLLTNKVSNIEDQYRQKIIDALDFLILGF